MMYTDDISRVDVLNEAYLINLFDLTGT